jgi:hypothetical protein
MTDPHLSDAVVTAFVDEACTADAAAVITAHLRACPSCRARVTVESLAKQTVQARAAAARVAGVPLPFRPRVWRLGRPALPKYASLVLLTVALAGGAALVWPRTAASSVVGTIGDSYCGYAHRFSAHFNVSDAACTLGCVRGGAEFVLVTDAAVYRVSNQAFPTLALFANKRVVATGLTNGHTITVARLEAAP